METSQFVFKTTNISLLFEKYYFCPNNQTLSQKYNTIEYTKTNKYFHQII